jgi:hypothetical protein
LCSGSQICIALVSLDVNENEAKDSTRIISKKRKPIFLDEGGRKYIKLIFKLYKTNSTDHLWVFTFFLAIFGRFLSVFTFLFISFVKKFQGGAWQMPCLSCPLSAHV